MTPPLFPQWTIIFGVVIGAFFGSFLNMVIYRLPRGLSFSEPKRSFCPTCKHSLNWMDLFPLISWASTLGKCRYCKEPIAVRYEIVELVTAALFGGVWWRFMSGRAEPQVVAAVAFALCVCGLVAIIFIDWELYIIPDEINAFILIVAVVYRAFNGTLMTALEGALLGWGLIWGIALLGRLLFGKDAMGDGDVKMMRGIGALIGPLLLLANVGIAVILGIVGGVVGIVLAGRQAKTATADEAPEDEAPYVPTPIWVVLASGGWYLLCLDVVCLFVKPLDLWITSKFPQETVEEEDDWKPTATTIPFGPYLAAGAIICMIFGPAVESGMQTYWKHQTGAGVASRKIYESTSTISGKASSQIKPKRLESLTRSAGRKLIC